MPAAATQHDLQDGLLLPGYIDTQVNGGGGVLFGDAPTVESLRTIARAHAKFGTTGFLPTLISGDYALIRAAVADKAGNCRFHASARNFNPPAAMSGRITIVEAEEVVEVGELDPDGVHLPGIFVKRIVALTPEQASRKDIEKRTTRPRPDDEKEGSR